MAAWALHRSAAAALLLLLLAVSSATAHRHLRGNGNGGNPPGKPVDTPTRKFNFKGDGGARAFLDKLDPAKVARILANSAADETLEQVAKRLDDDDDFVSAEWRGVAARQHPVTPITAASTQAAADARRRHLLLLAGPGPGR